MRDTEMLLEMTGIGKLVRSLKLPFIDLNLDAVEKVPITNGFTDLKEFFLPKTVMEADAVVSVPKMKTHHWAGMTGTMKNLFGTVPGRIYGWPKNLLHFKGIPQCVMDLQHTVKPAFGFVDAIVAMEGDGPIFGTARQSHFVAVSTDLAAVDATCARAMNISLSDLPYILLAGAVVGNVEEKDIQLIGTPLDKLRQPFEPPPCLKNKSLLVGAANAGS